MTGIEGSDTEAGGQMRPFRPNEFAFAGVGVTFFRCPLTLDPDELATADAAIVGAPFDGGTTYRPGARFGPRAIREADYVGEPAYQHPELANLDPFRALKVVDYGDAPADPNDLEASHDALREKVAEVLAADAVPFVLGGDHSVSAPMMQSLAEHFGPEEFSVVHFDTHADVEPSHSGTNHHGTPFSRAAERGFLEPGNMVKVGLRGGFSYLQEEFDWMTEHGARWHTMGEILDRGLEAVVSDAIEHAQKSASRTYLTVDIDVLDPAFAPGTGTPEPGGMTTRELLWAVREVAKSLDLCAMDLVEVSPPYDHAGITALAGNRVVVEALSGTAHRRARCSPPHRDVES
ncbi:MAG: agmatinase [Rubrobacteraceae bacterium]